MRDFITVAKEYIAKRREQSRIAEQHLRLGLEHARVNRQRVILEEELINNFPRRDFTDEDGSRVIVGTTTSRLYDRVKFIAIEVASTCKCGKATSTLPGRPPHCPECQT